MYEERKKDLPVFSQRVASNLMLMGFKLYNVAKNKKFEGKNVFYSGCPSQSQNTLYRGCNLSDLPKEYPQLPIQIQQQIWH